MTDVRDVDMVGSGEAGSGEVSLVYGSTGHWLLDLFNRAGVLVPVDVHTSVRLCRLSAETNEQVALAVALAVRAPRAGHISVDLVSVRTVAGADTDQDIDIDALPWPEPREWLERVSVSPLVAVGEDDDDRPVRLIGTSLYLDRYWRDEVAVAADLRARAGEAPPSTDAAALTRSLARLFARTADQDQQDAVATAVGRRFAVIAGGPGTGKTTTVARFLAALHEQADARGERPPLTGLAAPTGKAAARLEEAMRAEVARMVKSGTLTAPVGRRMADISGSTLHRLLGSRPRTARFRYHRGLRLPHDVIVVDEASMVSLTLMARLVEAVRPDARLVLVGDPQQLISVEAGAVLADVVGPATDLGAKVAGATASPAPAGSPRAASIALLRTNHRFSGALADLASAVQRGDDDAVVGVLRREDASVDWLDRDVGATPALLRGPMTEWTRPLIDAARRGDATGAVHELGRHRLLCAHRRGPHGALAWDDWIETWLSDAWPELVGEGAWYAGRPVMVTSNDYSLRLFNGDTGVTVARHESSGSQVNVVFDDGGGTPRPVSPSRLADVETVYAMTVHKSQGSEFERVTLLLPPPSSRLLTRELLYTAITRARKGLLLAGTEDAIRVAVRRRIARASGLTERLWGHV